MLIACLVHWNEALCTLERIKFPGSPGSFAQSLGWQVLNRLSRNRFFWPVSDWLFFLPSLTGQIHLFPEQQILPSYFNLLYFWQVISCVGEQIKITTLPNMKYKDFLTGYFELFSWWIYFNLIFAMQVTERNDIEWFAILQSKHRNGVTYYGIPLVWLLHSS